MNDMQNIENNDMITMNRIAFERMQAKDERNDQWRNIVIVILAVLLAITIALHFISDALWRKAWSEFDYVFEDTVEVEAQQDGSGVNIVGGGDIDYGTDSNDYTQETSNENAP